MNFNESTGVIKDFLPEGYGAFVGIDSFQVSGAPAPSSRYIDPIQAPAVGQRLPVGKSPFILRAACHRFRPRAKPPIPPASVCNPAGNVTATTMGDAL